MRPQIFGALLLSALVVFFVGAHGIAAPEQNVAETITAGGGTGSYVEADTSGAANTAEPAKKDTETGSSTKCPTGAKCEDDQIKGEPLKEGGCADPNASAEIKQKCQVQIQKAKAQKVKCVESPARKCPKIQAAAVNENHCIVIINGKAIECKDADKVTDDCPTYSQTTGVGASWKEKECQVEKENKIEAQGRLAQLEKKLDDGQTLSPEEIQDRRDARQTLGLDGGKLSPQFQYPLSDGSAIPSSDRLPDGALGFNQSQNPTGAIGGSSGSGTLSGSGGNDQLGGSSPAPNQIPGYSNAQSALRGQQIAQAAQGGNAGGAPPLPQQGGFSRTGAGVATPNTSPVQTGSLASNAATNAGSRGLGNAFNPSSSQFGQGNAGAQGGSAARAATGAGNGFQSLQQFQPYTQQNQGGQGSQTNNGGQNAPTAAYGKNGYGQSAPVAYNTQPAAQGFGQSFGNFVRNLTGTVAAPSPEGVIYVGNDPIAYYRSEDGSIVIDPERLRVPRETPEGTVRTPADLVQALRATDVSVAARIRNTVASGEVVLEVPVGPDGENESFTSIENLIVQDEVVDALRIAEEAGIAAKNAVACEVEEAAESCLARRVVAAQEVERRVFVDELHRRPLSANAVTHFVGVYDAAADPTQSAFDAESPAVLEQLNQKDTVTVVDVVADVMQSIIDSLGFLFWF